ncbi:MAG: hypothetical protein WKH64_02165 [Chloroflexia bacterium]
MNQPLALPDEDGVGSLDGEIIHPLRVERRPYTVHNSEPAVCLPDVRADLQLRRLHPALLPVVDRVGWGRS